MSFDTAKMPSRYLELLHQNDKKKGEIHFFGGEPMIVPELVQFAVEYARYEAGKNKSRFI
jgi:sulfatase maturation enzyme AslB (radical SAM superfamily)